MAKRGKLSRRSFLTRVAGAALTTGAAGAVTGCASTGYTDSDPYDPVGGGRGRLARRNTIIVGACMCIFLPLRPANIVYAPRPGPRGIYVI